MTLDFRANMPLTLHKHRSVKFSGKRGKKDSLEIDSIPHLLDRHQLNQTMILFPTRTIRAEKAKLHRFAFFAQRDQ